MPNTDLDDLKAAQTVKLVGTDTLGQETYPAQVDLGSDGIRRLQGQSLSMPYSTWLTSRGQMFSAHLKDFNLASKTAYNNMFVIGNPVGSGKTLALCDWSFNVVSATAARFELYMGATYTGGTGTAMARTNMLGGSVVVSVADVRYGATMLTTGASFKEFAQAKGNNSLQVAVDGTTQIGPGSALLVAGWPDAANALVSVSLKWGEL